MTSARFAEFILDNDIIGFHEKPLTLKSGRQSHFYVNWRKASNDAFLLDKLTDFIANYVEEQKLSFDTLYGVPEGASKTAVITAFRLAKRSADFSEGSHIISMGRAKPKPHGDPSDKFFIGAPRGRTFVLEDTITTGLSLFQCLDQLKEAGVNVAGVLSLTDRSEVRDDGLTAAEFLEKNYKIPYYPMSKAPDLLLIAVRDRKPADSLVKALAEELGMTVAALRGAV